ncbi:hypothetical protein M3147_03640 [Agromyces mediolanus]|uniref:hypothetical protein n=1 Tax=Agromyces mediolanus TaxID=41986 RepID=UPI00203BE81B|nr:hypothetical protein [Agromyces mediolanus]MCM3656337.1 hypothetical protein [Agromyces mediolanus]
MARKIAGIVQANHLSRFDLKYDVLHLPREARARSIRLFGEKVAPRVRELLADDADDWRLTGRTPAQIIQGGKAVHA